MKSYRITVNGNVYDVTVEETTGNGAAPVQQSAAPAPQPVKTQQAAPQPAGNAGSIEIKSSVPGKGSESWGYRCDLRIYENGNPSCCTSGWNDR